MMKKNSILQNVVAVSASSTPAFLQEVFRLYRSRTPFAVLRADTADHPALNGSRTRIEPQDDGPGWARLDYAGIDSGEPAQIVFSSGTESLPKAIVLSHRNLHDVVSRLNAIMEVTDEIREYVGVPVTYSFGLGRARAVAAASGAAYIPRQFDPMEIRRMLEKDEINAISAVPSLWRIVLNQPALLTPVADRVKWIEIGSQFMSADEKLAMRRLFPNARIVQHYGLTEASRTSFLDISRASEAELDSVGTTMGTVDLRIDGEGAICIRGPHVALGRLTDKGLVPLANDEGWLVTRDRGALRNGHLYFLGRLDDQINISGIKIAAELLERDISQRLSGLEQGFAVAAVPDPMRGEAALLAVEDSIAANAPRLRAAAQDALEQHGISGAETLRTMQIAALPRTGTGKVQRSRLRERYQQVTPQSMAADSQPSERGFLSRLSGRRHGDASVLHIYRKHFPNAEIDSSNTFDQLGGDSLNYLAVALDLERRIGDLPRDWQMLPIAELEKKRASGGLLTKMDTPTLFRALAITLVVMGHFSVFDYGGTGAFTLFLIAGMNFGALTVPAVVQGSTVRPIFGLMLRVATVTWLYITLNWLVTGYGGGLLSYLMISNWVDPNYPGGVWFVNVYLQILLGLAVLMAIPRLREQLAGREFEALLGLTILMVGVLVIFDRLYDTTHLYHRLPHLLAWMFLSGALAHFATTLPQKVATLIVFLAGWAAFSERAITLLTIATPILIFVPLVPLPRILVPAIRLIAGASLMIYLTHFQFKSVAEKLMGESSGTAAVAAIAGGVVVWMCYRPIDNWLRAVINSRPSARKPVMGIFARSRSW